MNIVTVNYLRDRFLENVWPFLQAAAYESNGKYYVSFDGRAYMEGTGGLLLDHVRVIVESDEKDFGPFWSAFDLHKNRTPGDKT